MSRRAWILLGLLATIVVGGTWAGGRAGYRAETACQKCMREWEEVGRKCGPRCQETEGHNECLERCWEQVQGGDVALPNCGPVCGR